MVYTLWQQPGWLAKIYTGPMRPNYLRKLAWMRDHPPDDPTLSQGHASLAWPVDLLFDERRQPVGYLMPHIRNAVPLLEVFNPRRRAQVLPNFDWQYLHRTARNLATALGAVHERGYVVGDLNESNVLVTPAALITLIDTDSFQVRETVGGRSVMTHRCPVAKLEYTPPELQGRSLKRTLRLPEQDRFGLGVLIFQLLLDGSHPYRAQWLGSGDPLPLEERIRRGCFPYQPSPPCPVAPPAGAPGLELLHPAVSRLVRRCFIAGTHDPQERPSPGQWEQALAEAEGALRLCPNQHYYSGHLRRCPFCTGTPRQIQTPLPSLVHSARPARSRPAPASPAQPAMPAAAMLASPAVRLASYPATRLPGAQTQPAASGVRNELLEVIRVGGSMSGLAGLFLGALAAGILLVTGKAVDWRLVWALGAAAGGVGRGWHFGSGVGRGVSRRFGWERAWQAIGALAGGLGAFSFGWGLDWSAPFLVILIAAGVLLGRFLGQLLWTVGDRVGWVEIWTVAGAFGGAWLGWILGGALGGILFAGLGGAASAGLAAWVLGALSGALGGLLAGVSIELLAKLFGLN